MQLLERTPDVLQGKRRVCLQGNHTLCAQKAALSVGGHVSGAGKAWAQSMIRRVCAARTGHTQSSTRVEKMARPARGLRPEHVCKTSARALTGHTVCMLRIASLMWLTRGQRVFDEAQRGGGRVVRGQGEPMLCAAALLKDARVLVHDETGVASAVWVVARSKSRAEALGHGSLLAAAAAELKQLAACCSKKRGGKHVVAGENGEIGGHKRELVGDGRGRW